MSDKVEGKLALTQEEQISSEVIERVTPKVAQFLRNKDQTPDVVRVVMQEVSEHYQGPLPHPDHLRRFEQITPGASNRLIEMAEKEQAHRHSMQRREMNYPYFGLAAGLLVALSAVAGSVFLATNGVIAVAISLLGLPLMGCIGWFVKARVSLNPPPQQDPVRRSQVKRRR